MYQVLIVDDDKLIVEDLRRLIDWNTVGCDFPAWAPDGRRALEMLTGKTYDIILTDISMPVMDGVELIRRAKEQRIPGVFIVISNYDDFVFVKEAMKYGASEYLLKYEINKDNLLQQIVYAQQLCDQHTSGDLSEKSVKLLRQQNIRRVFQGELPDGTLVQPGGMGIWVPIYLLLFGKTTEKDLETVKEQSEHVLEESQCMLSMVGSVSANALVLVIGVENPSYLFVLQIVSDYLQRLIIKLQTVGIKIAGYIGQFAHNEDLLRKSIRALGKKEDAYFYMKPCGIFQTRGESPKSWPGFDQEKWIQICRSDAEPDAAAKLLQFFQEYSVSPSVVKSNCVKLIGALENDSKAEQTEISAVLCARTAWEIQCMMARFLEEKRRLRIEKRACVRPEIRRALTYIAENYEKQITLSDLAATAGLSSNYFCTVFKNETGLNYSEYLNRFRLEKAKMLLQTTSLRTYEVSERVGFRDYRYFCRIFKETTGITCSEFRRPGEVRHEKQK